MRPINIGLIAMLLSIFVSMTAFANDEKFMIIPDSFHISERVHQPEYSIEKLPDGYKVKIRFASDVSGINEYLYRLYGADLASKEIYEAELMPLKIQHLSTVFDEKNIVRSWKQTFQLGGIYLEYYFTNDVNEEQIHKLFMFGIVFATADVVIQCSGQITSKVCDQRITGVPLFNQFSLDKGLEYRTSFEAYTELSRYISFTRLGKAYLNLYQLGEVDSYLKNQLFSGSRCKLSIDAEQVKICSLIEKYGESHSVASALANLSKIIFGDRPLDASRTFFILDNSEFSLKNISELNLNQVFGNPDFIKDLKDDACYLLGLSFGDFIESRFSPAYYSLSQAMTRCSIIASGQDFVDLKFADDRSIFIDGKSFGVGMDAVFRVNIFGCQSNIFNIEGSELTSGYTSPPSPYFNCSGSNTDSTHCKYSDEERRVFDTKCSEFSKSALDDYLN